MNGFQTFLSFLTAAGVIVFAIGQWRSGRLKGNSDAISTANGTIDVLNKSLKAVQDELTESKATQQKHHDDIIRLQEQLKHSKDNEDKLLAILQDRNPETTTFMKFMTDTAAASQVYMNETSKILQDISENYKEIHEFIIAAKPIILAAEKRTT